MKNYFLEYNNRDELNKFFEAYHMLLNVICDPFCAGPFLISGVFWVS